MVRSRFETTTIRQMEQLRLESIERFHIDTKKESVGYANQSSVKGVAVWFGFLSIIMYFVGSLTVSIIQGCLCTIMSLELYEAASYLDKTRLRLCGFFWTLHALGSLTVGAVMLVGFSDCTVPSIFYYALNNSNSTNLATNLTTQLEGQVLNCRDTIQNYSYLLIAFGTSGIFGGYFIWGLYSFSLTTPGLLIQPDTRKKRN